MALTNGQQQTLATALRASADATVIAALAVRNDVALTAWCNATASPAVKAWREDVDPRDIDEATPWSNFDNITQAGKRDSWGYLLRYSRNFSKSKVRKWVTDVWGNATAGSDAEKILTGCATENMSNGEVIFGGTDDITGTVTAKKRNVLGPFSLDDVSNALNKF